MSFSNRLKKLSRQQPPRSKSSGFSGGIYTLLPCVLENVQGWISNEDATLRFSHSHQRMILKLILSGSITTFVDGMSFPMHSGDAIVFFPYQIHSSGLVSGNDYEYLAITFTEKNLDYTPFFPLKNRILSVSKEDEKLLCRAFSAIHSREALVQSEGIAALELFFARKLTEKKNITHDMISENGIFQKISTYIRKNFTGKISVKTLAAEFGICELTIRRLFRKNCGDITPGELVRRYRFQYAKELLGNTCDTIAVIAAKCGYGDAFTFSRAFTKAEGISPSAFRKNPHHPKDG